MALYNAQSIWAEDQLCYFCDVTFFYVLMFISIVFYITITITGKC